MAKDLPNAKKLHSLFKYKDGVLYWKVSRSPRIKVGDVAGWRGVNGYWNLSIDGSCFSRHRVIYAMHNGICPTDKLIDHINRTPGDDRIENLRLVTPEDNNKNQRTPCDNKTGVKGVFWEATVQSWRAYINTGGKRKYLGRYRDKQSAVHARKEAEARLGFI